MDKVIWIKLFIIIILISTYVYLLILILLKNDRQLLCNNREGTYVIVHTEFAVEFRFSAGSGIFVLSDYNELYIKSWASSILTMILELTTRGYGVHIFEFGLALFFICSFIAYWWVDVAI